ncbi:MAG: hypothetical protein GX800_09960 [Clostridiaceae bacterium]|jgi:hypothetical protein|nr:hypothetical protein [Clostridiaceae bacterium]
MSNNTNYLLDKVYTHKIGKTIFTVSSFLKSDSQMTFLEILKKLIEKETKL